MKSLVIAEKPSVARDIARVLKCTKNISGAIEGNQYVVTWGLGHLVELADPEHYDKKYKNWKMEDLPMLPKEFHYEVIKQTGKQFSNVKTQIHRKDVQEIVIATDAGREGELVARLILLKSGNKKPIKRLWISSVTDKAIREGFAHLKDGRAYDNLYHAAMCRAKADWLVGINATRALTCKYNAQLSCGRVQTPTLAMIAKREEEIKKFIPKPYYGLKAMAEGMTFTWRDGKTKGMRSFQKEKMESLEKQLSNQDGMLVSVKKKPKKVYAPLLYDLTELQRDANKRFGLSAKETLNIMQRLYENHKVLTYPRTDSRYISADIVPTIGERLQACAVGPYRKSAGSLGAKLGRGKASQESMAKKLWGKASFVNDAKVSDHHAIIPTEQFVNLEHMTNEERKIYDLVVKRFLAVLYPPAEYEQTELILKIKEEEFLANGKIVIAKGWQEVYEQGDYDSDDEEEELKSQTLKDIRQGSRLKIERLILTEGKTTPPAHFNEATLLSAMENPVAYMESHDKEMAKTLGETGGLGTVATRADIIEKLFSSFLLEKRGKDIYLTSKAKQLLELVPEDLRKPELTADWEMKLSKIAKGNLKEKAFMDEIIVYAKEVTSEIRGGEGTFRHDNLTNKKCPVCGKRMLAVKGKNSEMLVCQDRECNHREVISRTSNARCPNCHKKLQLVGKGDTQMFTCVCGYREKLSTFQERRKKEGAGVSKRDVQKYMNKQKEEKVNTAFADLLSGLKL